jgi:hypothetical protein
MGSLLIVAGIVAICGAVEAARSPGVISSGGSAQIGFFGTFIFGILPVTAYGAPMYVWLSRTGRANWLSVSAIALAPASLLIPIDLEMGSLALLCAPVVAWLTHLGCRKSVSPNNSFKPKPLRGSA